MKLSIQQRFSLWAGLSLLSVVLVTALIGVWQFGTIKLSLSEQSRAVTEQQIDGYLQLLASDTTRQLRQPLEQALNSAEATAAVMRAIVSNSDMADKRPLAVSVLQQLLVSNPDFLGSYIAFEPNAFDGSDYLWQQTAGSDHRGRFMPYVVRDDSNQFSIETLEGLEDSTVDDNGVRAGEYYLCSRDTKANCVIDPYLYPIDGQQVLLTSLVAPVLVNDRFIGISGVDIAADFLQSVITNVAAELYQGSGTTLLVSPRGVIAGHSQQPELIGQNLQALPAALASDIRQSSDQGALQLLRREGEFVVLSPFQLAGSEQFWITYLAVPETVVLAAVTAQQQMLNSAQGRFITVTTVFGLLLALAGVAVVWLVARSSIRPLADMTELVASIAEGEGDLTRQLDIKRNDETGSLSGYLNTFISKLRKLIQQLLPLGAGVSELSAEGRRISEQTSAQMLEQQQLVDEMVSAVTEMAASAQQIAGNADRTSQFVHQANDSAQTGAGLVQQTAKAIHQVNDSVQQTEQAMLELEKNSAAIEDILGVIQGIAEQTNLLALNAAIEAARAGDKGRGFAVVADEVRALASRTQDATVDIHQKLAVLQQGNRQASSAMTESGKQVAETVRLAQSAESALLEIQTAIKEVTEMTFQTASATEQQSAVCEQVNSNLIRVSQLVETTSDGAQRLSQLGHDLDQAALGLQQRLAAFKV